MNSFHATWTNANGDSKLGDNRYDRRKVGLKLAMYDHIGKFAFAVGTWNCRNFDDTIDLHLGSNLTQTFGQLNYRFTPGEHVTPG